MRRDETLYCIYIQCDNVRKDIESKIGTLNRVFKITENRANRYITGVGAGNGEDKHIY